MPDGCAVWCVADWTVLVARVPHFVGREAICLIDGKVTQQALDLVQIMNIHVALGTDVNR